jgi:hypothetical protein
MLPPSIPLQQLVDTPETVKVYADSLLQPNVSIEESFLMQHPVYIPLITGVNDSLTNEERKIKSESEEKKKEKIKNIGGK